ncbi:MAG: aldo/keto reductase [Desulfarculaceae bacterium]|nr:aldo/keto reductase [Desulfarculaceae bacterium]MCF8074477.1 aldo/keto reductase [Desulfarculaceae bacterium]MCF8103681.1 aldo/keto reductase [Desulfarculaceae bacterium]MCF8118009.1 aldo/keto reductase [Desulfarculaceae bacterium]
MKNVTLGNTGLVVSEFGFGGIPLTRVPEDEAARIIHRALELGVRFFDTARLYGDSEVKMARALEGRRDEVVLASKTISRDAKGAEADLAQTLDNLRTDHLDLYQLHNVAKDEVLAQVMAPGGAYEAAQKARQEGRVGHIGFSSHHPDIALQAIESGKFATVQFACNFVEDEAAGKVFAAAQKRGMGCIAMKPLGGGLLERADLCFRWLQTVPGVVPIPGIQAMSELDQIAALYADRKPLSDVDRADMERIRSELGSRFCHRCGYCMPCPNGIDIPIAMLFRSQVRRFPAQELARLSGRAMEAIEDCEQCGECEARCPYELPIPEMLGEILNEWRDFQARHGLA